MTVTDFPFVATVHRPGLPEIHLGFDYRHQAEHATFSLSQDLHNTQHIEGTRITFSPTLDGVTPKPPVPTDAAELATAIEQEEELTSGLAFPDLFSRLKAQIGYDQAAQIWHNACVYFEHDETDE